MAPSALVDQPLRPRPIRPLPSKAALDADEGVRTGLSARVVLAATVVFGQLWAIAAGLDRYLKGRTGEAWILFAFSAVSFGVVLVLTLIRPAARREEPKRGLASTQIAGLYRPAPVERTSPQQHHEAPPGSELTPPGR